jgi:hypothetical protein
MDRPGQSHRAVLEDHFDALRMVRAAGVLFLILVIVALAVQIGLYCAVRFGGVLAGSPGSPACPVATATAPTAPPPGAKTAHRAETWGPVVEILAPMCRIVGLVAACLLALTYFIGMNVCLAGRLSGASGTTSAFFWSMLLVGLLFPWQRLFPPAGVCTWGVFCDFAELQHVAVVKPAGLVDHILHYARYLGYPGLAILIALLAGLRFGCGYHTAGRQFEAAKAE